MICKACNVEMDPKLIEFEDEYRGEPVTVSATGYGCSNCNGDWFGIEDVAEYGRHVADAFRRKHRLLTSNDIREARERLRMTQEAFARYLDVGVASVKRWEWGLVQDRSHDKLIRVLTDPDEALEAARKARALMAPEPPKGLEDAFSSVETHLTRTFMLAVPEGGNLGATRTKRRSAHFHEFSKGMQKHVRLESETALPNIPPEAMR